MNAHEATKLAAEKNPIHRTFVTDTAALEAIEDANVRAVAVAAIRQNHIGHGCTLDIDVPTFVTTTKDTPLGLLLAAAQKANRER